MLIKVYSIHVHVLGYFLLLTLLAIDQHQNGAYFFCFFGFINTDMKNYTTYCINEIHTFRNSFTDHSVIDHNKIKNYFATSA